MNQERLKKLKLKAHFAKKSLFYLNKFILYREFRDSQSPWIPDYPWQDISKWVQTWRKKRRKLIMIHRNSFKTSCIAVGYPIFTLLRNPDASILILAQERAYAIKILGLIKRQMTENEELIAINGGAFRGNLPWKEWEIFIKGRKSLGSTMPSINTAGIDSVKAGPHYDLMIFDDVVSEKNTATEEAQKQVIENYRKCSPMLKQGGKMIIIGTPYAFGDLYDYIIHTPAESRHFELCLGQARKNSAVLPDVSSFKDVLIFPEGREGTLLMPEVLSHQFLDDEKEKDPVWYTSQYEIGLISSSTAEFDKQWFRYYSPQKLPERLRVCIAVDPAFSRKTRADYTAMVVAGQDELGNIFILDIVRDRFDPSQLINKLYELYWQYRPFLVGLETNSAEYLRYSLEQEGKIRGLLPIKELKHYGKNQKKASRIRSLIPLYKKGLIWHKAQDESCTYVHQSQKILESELLQFTGEGKGHDDVCDATSMLLELFQPKGLRRGISYSRRYQPADIRTGY